MPKSGPKPIQTVAQVHEFAARAIGAQTFLFAGLLRLLLDEGVVSSEKLGAAFDAIEDAARKQVPDVAGMLEGATDLLRKHLALPAKTHHGA